MISDLLIMAAVGTMLPAPSAYQCNIRRNGEGAVADVRISFAQPKRDAAGLGRLPIADIKIEDKALMLVFLTSAAVAGDVAENGMVRIRPKRNGWPNFTPGITMTPTNRPGLMQFATRYTTATGKRGNGPSSYYDEFGGLCTQDAASASNPGDQL